MVEVGGHHQLVTNLQNHNPPQRSCRQVKRLYKGFAVLLESLGIGNLFDSHLHGLSAGHQDHFALPLLEMGMEHRMGRQDLFCGSLERL